MTHQSFLITGLHCEACTKLTAKRIMTLEGVTSAVVDLSSGTANIEAGRTVTADEINEVFAGSGYIAEEK